MDLLFTIHDLLFPGLIRYLQHDRSLTFAVRVAPRAARSGVTGKHDGALKVRIAAPPADGAANRELIKLLARAFKLPKSSVEIISGAKSKTKIVHIHWGDISMLEQLIQTQ